LRQMSFRSLLHINPVLRFPQRQRFATLSLRETKIIEQSPAMSNTFCENV